MELIVRILARLTAAIAILAAPAITIADSASSVSPGPLVARYVQTTTRHDGKLVSNSSWYLYRDADRVVTVDDDGRTLEIWSRTVDGGVALRRVFHQWRRIIDYTPEELESRGAAPRWEALSSILTEDVRARFEPGGDTAPSFGEQAQTLQRRANERTTNIVWLPRVALPARIEQSGDRYTTLLSLVALGDQPSSGWPSVSEADWADYQPIDATDFGDMDTDPFVQEVARIDARAGGLGRLAYLHVVE